MVITLKVNAPGPHLSNTLMVAPVLNSLKIFLECYYALSVAHILHPAMLRPAYDTLAEHWRISASGITFAQLTRSLMLIFGSSRILRISVADT